MICPIDTFFEAVPIEKLTCAVDDVLFCLSAMFGGIRHYSSPANGGITMR
jgi:hypothetical protein